jgi:ferredoxin-NADP reductase
VVPLMAMIRHRAAVNSTVPTRLLVSARTADDLIYHTELDRLAAADATLEVRYTLTRSQPPGWTGYTRRLDRALIAEVAWPPPVNPRIFICGPTPLVESAATACTALGYDATRIKTECFGGAGGA